MSKVWNWLVLILLWLITTMAYAGTRHYYYTDPQGTVLAEADASGNVTATYDYAPYGTAVANMSPAPDGPGYTGHVNDPDSGLVYMQARYYDPAVGRFLSSDPAPPVASDLFNFNRYDYTNNNPINHIDPDGRCVDGITCDQMVQSYGKWADANPEEADKIARDVGVPGVTAMLVASGLGEVVGTVKTSIMIDKTLTDSSAAGATKALGERVSEVHSVLDPIAQKQRTTAGLDTAEGIRIIGSGAKRDLTPAQRQTLGAGETAAKMPGEHAEVTVLNRAAKDGLTPDALEATRTICPSCQQAIENAGGKIVTPTRAEW